MLTHDEILALKVGEVCPPPLPQSRRSIAMDQGAGLDPCARTREDRGWLIVFVRPKSESRVKHALTALGVPTYLPQLQKRARHGRREYDVTRALFPGYLFVQVASDGHMHAVREIDGFIRFASGAGNPLRLADELVGSIMFAEMGGAFDQRELRKKQRVKITAPGPYEGMIGKIMSVPAHCRIWVVLDEATSVGRIGFPVAKVERVA